MTAKRKTPSRRRLVTYWRQLGPGLITGASDNDPSGIGTYSSVGASTGFKLLWLAPLTLPFLVAVQSMAARIGAVRHEGLGKVIEDRYGRKVLAGSLVILLTANVATIAADLGGIGAGVHLLAPIPTSLIVVVVGAGLIAVEVLWSYERFASIVKWTTLVLLLYVVSGFAARPPWGAVLTNTVAPHFSFDRETLAAAVALLGTTISPYMFFWIASEEVEEAREHHDRRSQSVQERDRRKDVVSGMIYANLVFYFIVLANAATLGAHHKKVDTAQDAAKALGPIVGHYATVLFAVGIVGGGLIAVPVLAGSCAYPVAELFRWNEGLDREPREARGFYAVIGAAVGIGVVANFIGVDPVKGLVYAAVLQGFLAPVLVALLTMVARDKRVMGRQRAGWFDTAFGFGTAIVMAGAGLALVFATFLH